MECNKNHEKTDLPNENNTIHFISLHGSFFPLGFTSIAQSHLRGCANPMHTITVDASFPIGEEPAEEDEEFGKLEDQVCEELKTFVERYTHRGVLVLETLLIPGEGRTYRKEFLQKLEKICVDKKAH
jgi:hypothetical protein